jgi:hypothetical protein
METFVIQIPSPGEGTDEPRSHELHGVVEHVRSGRRHPFAETRELLAFLRADYRRLPKEAEQ